MVLKFFISGLLFSNVDLYFCQKRSKGGSDNGAHQSRVINQEFGINRSVHPACFRKWLSSSRVGRPLCTSAAPLFRLSDTRGYILDLSRIFGQVSLVGF